ncbi:MAG: DUF429 domain-containing protein [Planctomycetes bacterium]|nr:DUF429 domain-containing protein [Planctomycetota bacterium]
MSTDIFFLGWDVGPWKCSGESQDALQLLKWGNGTLSLAGTSFRGNLLESAGGQTVQALLKAAGQANVPANTRVVVAVDAVFGWPKEFRSLLESKVDYLPRCGKSDRNTGNKYLYRETERFVDEKFDLGSHPPMTAVGGAIGSAGTKAQFFVARARKANECYVPPLDTWDVQRARQGRVTIIEVYPGVTKFSRAFKEIVLPGGAKASLLGKGDLADAMRAALVAACYASTAGVIEASFPKVYVPTDATLEDRYDVEAIQTEGWIFSPK